VPVLIRDEGPLPDNAIVIRGGLMLVRDLANAAERCEEHFGFPGLSVFARSGPSVRELLLSARALRLYPVIRQSSAGDLRALRCELLPTGVAPHFTLRLADASFRTLSLVRDAFGPPFPNPVFR